MSQLFKPWTQRERMPDDADPVTFDVDTDDSVGAICDLLAELAEDCHGSNGYCETHSRTLARCPHYRANLLLLEEQPAVHYCIVSRSKLLDLQGFRAELDEYQRAWLTIWLTVRSYDDEYDNSYIDWAARMLLGEPT